MVKYPLWVEKLLYYIYRIQHEGDFRRVFEADYG